MGNGDRQVRTIVHTEKIMTLNEKYEDVERSLDEDDKRFFVNLFEESTFEGSQAAALEMKMIAKQKTKENQVVLLFFQFVHSCSFQDGDAFVAK
jgi:hypothetical protein